MWATIGRQWVHFWKNWLFLNWQLTLEQINNIITCCTLTSWSITVTYVPYMCSMYNCVCIRSRSPDHREDHRENTRAWQRNGVRKNKKRKDRVEESVKVGGKEKKTPRREKKWRRVREISALCQQYWQTAWERAGRLNQRLARTHACTHTYKLNVSECSCALWLSLPGVHARGYCYD